MYVDLGIGVLRSLTAISSISLDNSKLLGFGILVALASIGISCLFIYMIGKGKNWARITFLVLNIINIPFTFPFELFDIVQLVVVTAAVVLLFQETSSNWFRQMKQNK
jgi:hypothetical protein